jgi:hypothetical protein
MAGDVNRLFSMINQANLPYQVFEDASVQPQPEAVPMAEPEGQIDTPTTEIALEHQAPANEGSDPVYPGFFKAYDASQPDEAPQGVALADIFRRMAASR